MENKKLLEEIKRSCLDNIKIKRKKIIEVQSINEILASDLWTIIPCPGSLNLKEKDCGIFTCKDCWSKIKDDVSLNHIQAKSLDIIEEKIIDITSSKSIDEMLKKKLSILMPCPQEFGLKEIECKYTKNEEFLMWEIGEECDSCWKSAIK